jgi:hypothetical protein
MRTANPAVVTINIIMHSQTNHNAKGTCWITLHARSEKLCQDLTGKFCLPHLISSVTSSNPTLHSFTILFGLMFMPLSFSTTSSSPSNSRQHVQQSTRWLQINDTIFFNKHTVQHLDTIKVFYLIHQLMHNWFVLKTILKFTLKLTLKQLQHVSV